MTPNLRFARRVALFAALGAVPGMDSEAQDRLRIQPFVSLSEVYDSDVFSTPADPRADLVTRITPGLTTTYESPAMTLSSRFLADFERFDRHPELAGLDARQQGTVSLTYRATPRVRVAAGGELLMTHTPQDLNLATSLAAPRARARRHTANASATRRFSPVTSGSLGYTFTGDRVGRSFATDTHGADATVERRVSARTAVRGRYRVQAFGFTTPVTHSRVTSHSVSIGVDHAIAPRLRASIDVGPRTTGDVARPELAASVACDCASVDLALAYTRTQTTVIGLAGAADVESVGMTIGRTFGRSLDVQVAPAFFSSTLAALRAEVYALAINVKRPISSRVAVELTLQGSLQRGHIYPGGAGEDVPRHTILARLVAGPAVAHPQR